MQYRFALVLSLAAGCQSSHTAATADGGRGGGGHDGGTLGDAGTIGDAADAGGAADASGTSTGIVKLALAQTLDVGVGVTFVSAGDLDGDGATDLAISSGDDAAGIYNVVLAKGTRDGTFTIAGRVVTSLPQATAIADFNRDGVPDIAGVAWDGMGPLPEFYLQGQGGFAYAKTTWADGVDYRQHLSAGDFDEDGSKDLVAAWADSQHSSDGGFVITQMPSGVVLQRETAYGVNTIEAVAGDFNGDGHQDVVAASGIASACKLYVGAGRGTVTFARDVVLPGGPITHIAALDLDRDGKTDLVAIHDNNTVTVSYGTAAGFTDPKSLPLASHSFFSDIVAGDFDHDGRLDLAISGSDARLGISVFLATESGWAPAKTLDPSGAANGMVVGDFNGDGFDDIAAGSLPSVVIYLSTL